MLRSAVIARRRVIVRRTAYSIQSVRPIRGGSYSHGTPEPRSLEMAICRYPIRVGVGPRSGPGVHSMTLRFRSDTLQAFELIEVKTQRDQEVVAAGRVPESHGDCTRVWEAGLAPSEASRRSHSVRPCLVASLVLAAMATCPLGCSVDPGPRERYYAARSVVVEAMPGNRSARLASWPRLSMRPVATFAQPTKAP